jgi:hypothetical protein
MKKIILSALLLGSLYSLFADTISLSSGKKVEGKILGFDRQEGLIVLSDYGEIHIKLGNLVSFTIDTADGGLIAEEKYKKDLQKSKMIQNGVSFDAELLRKEGFELIFDYDDYEFHAYNEDKGIGLVLIAEPLSISDSDYETISMAHFSQDAHQLKNLEKEQFSVGGKDIRMVGTQKVRGGLEYAYRMYFFNHEGLNYKMTLWSYTPLKEQALQILQPVIESFSFSEKK